MAGTGPVGASLVEPTGASIAAGCEASAGFAEMVVPLLANPKGPKPVALRSKTTLGTMGGGELGSSGGAFGSYFEKSGNLPNSHPKSSVSPAWNGRK